MQVKIKKSENAVIPSYRKEGDAGMDLTAIGITYTPDYISYKTGLFIEIPKGYVGLLFPRSSNSKKDLILSNSVGIIDSGFRGEIELRFKHLEHVDSDCPYKTYQHGDRVGQLIIMPYPQIEFEEVEELTTTQRGEGGFGSTNDN